MGKNMARIKDGIVENIEWVDGFTTESDDLKDICQCRVAVGDTYSDGKFYRNNVEILSYKGQLKYNIDLYDNALTEIAYSISAPIVISDEFPPTIESRKQAILAQINAIQTALAQGGLL